MYVRIWHRGATRVDLGVSQPCEQRPLLLPLILFLLLYWPKVPSQEDSEDFFAFVIDASAMIATWLSFAVTAVGLGVLISPANAINDKMDPFHSYRNIHDLCLVPTPEAVPSVASSKTSSGVTCAECRTFCCVLRNKSSLHDSAASNEHWIVWQG